MKVLPHTQIRATRRNQGFGFSPVFIIVLFVENNIVRRQDMNTRDTTLFNYYSNGIIFVNFAITI